MNNKLSEKELKFQKRGYEYCPHTLLRITDFDEAYYDRKLDKMFVNYNAYKAYLNELREDNVLKRKQKLAKKKSNAPKRLIRQMQEA